jgi:hypothetical protein
MIWLSVKRDLFIQNFLHIEKILPLTPLDFRGDYHENRIEGNLFYYHESKELPSIPDVRRIHKRRNFAFYSLTGSSLLEIGFNAGHSALLALTMNPQLVYMGLDLGSHSYTKPCFEYLESAFPGRVTMLLGDSRDTLPRLTHTHKGRFDLFHIDGGHGVNVAESDICNMLHIARPGDTILFDDLNVSRISLLCDYYIAKGLVTEIRPHFWEKREQILLRINPERSTI